MTITNEINAGFLVINKPSGFTSFDMIGVLRRITKIKRIGHTGTLDPFASGVLITCLGSYTRLAGLIESYDKSYQAVIKLGESTDTGDPTGKTITTNDVIPAPESVDQLRDKVLSIKELPIPSYSAVWIKGKRAYKYARQNITVDLPHRPVRVYDFQLLSYHYPHIEYSCRVSKGTYIRSISEWMAEQLGTLGHTCKLQRTAVGRIDLGAATPIDQIDENNWRQKLTDPRIIFADRKMLVLPVSDINLLNCGQSIAYDDEQDKDLFVIDHNRRLRSLCSLRGKILKPKINLKQYA